MRTELEALTERMAAFLRGPSSQSRAVLAVAERARERGWRALLFGGAVRDVYLGRAQRIRDVDLVVVDPPIQNLRQLFAPEIVRETRFGGLRLEVNTVKVDVWPLSATWAFQRGLVKRRTARTLAATTFLDIEAGVVEVLGSHSFRIVKAGALIRSAQARRLEVNLSENPYPALCVVRSLVLAEELSFRIGPTLGRYIASQAGVGVDAMLQAQATHYGSAKLSREQLQRALEEASEANLADEMSVGARGR